MANANFTDGDRGGNLCLVEYDGDPTIKSMHMFWDAAGGLFGQPYSRPLTVAQREMLKNQVS